MKSYRLVVRQQGRIVGHFDTTGRRRWKTPAWRGRCSAWPEGISANCWFLKVKDAFWKVRREACAFCPGRNVTEL